MTKTERLAEIIGAWRAQRERGAVDTEAIISQHPDLADELRARFRAVELLESRFPSEPHQIGEFRIIREIGRGGMGVVYEAEQASMERRVALKVLFPSITSSSNAVKRFQQEARAAGRLNHTNIVTVYQLGNDHGIWYSAMELVEGRPLSDVIADLRRSKPKPRESRLARRALDIKSKSDSDFTGTRTGTRAYYIRIAEMFADVADALQVAHDQGVVHRDIKPGNLLLDAEGNLKLVDFGLARLDDVTTLTMTGDIVGTPFYMSPEQMLGKSSALDHRTDVYSLGVTLCETLTLRTPFHGDNIQTVAKRILEQDPIPPRRWDKTIPRDLETIVLKAFEKEPAKRYANAEEMARDLRCFALGEAIRARRISPQGRAWRKIKRHKVRSGLVAGLVVSTAIAGAFWLHARSEGRRRAAEEARRIESEYEMLCVRAHEAVSVRAFSSSRLPGVGESAAQLFTRAIELAPDRPDAYFGRALLMRGRSVDQRLADVAAAERHGFSPRAVHLARAHVHMIGGRWKESEQEEQRAYEFEREGPADAFCEARLLLNRGLRPEAIALLTEAIEGAPRTGSLRYRALRKRAYAREQEGDFEGALADLAAVEEATDEPVRIQVFIAWLWRRLGHSDSSERLFGEALAACRAKGTEAAWHALCEACHYREETGWMGRATEEALRVHPRSAPLLVVRARFLGKSGDLAQALKTCQRAADLDPRNPWAFNAKRWILGKLGRRADALEAAERAAQLGPDSWGLHMNLGTALAGMGRRELAEQAFERALQLGPADSELLSNLATFYLNSDPEKALELAQRAVRLKPRFFFAHLRVGWALQRLGKHEAALAATERGVKLAPDNAGAAVDMAVRLKTLGRHADALQACDRAIEIDPDLANAHLSRGNILNNLGRHEEALQAFDRALECGFRNPNLMNQVAWFRATSPDPNLRDAARAVALAQEATKLAPKEGAIWNTLGVALCYAGKWKEAIPALEESMELTAGGSAFDWFFVAMAEHKLGQKDAREWYDKAVAWMEKNNPDDAEIKRFRAEAAEVLGRSSSRDSEDEGQ